MPAGRQPGTGTDVTTTPATGLGGDAAHDPLAEVRGLEERAFNAWPALQTVLAGGWLLRFADGYTKRANSLNALAPHLRLDEIIDVAAPLYARAGLPLVVRLSPLAGPEADACLEARGFSRRDETIVMTAPCPPGTWTIDAAARLGSAPDATWSEGFAAANAVPPAHRHTHDRMLAAIRMPAAFASLDGEGGRPIAWGLGVAERGRIGLFDIVTDPAARRQGAGRRLVTSLLAWGQAQGATGAYLQVVATNAPAIALYEWLGFRECYRYHYRIAP